MLYTKAVFRSIQTHSTYDLFPYKYRGPPSQLVAPVTLCFRTHQFCQLHLTHIRLQQVSLCQQNLELLTVTSAAQRTSKTDHGDIQRCSSRWVVASAYCRFLLQAKSYNEAYWSRTTFCESAHQKSLLTCCLVSTGRSTHG